VLRDGVRERPVDEPPRDRAPVEAGGGGATQRRLALDLAPAGRADALDAMEAAYAAAGVTRFAAWTHEDDAAMRADLEARGYTVDTATRAMGMALADLRVPRPDLALAPSDWGAYVRHLEAAGLPAGLLAGVDPTAFHLLLAARDGETVATALAFEAGGPMLQQWADERRRASTEARN
jgi:hypothetical protein